MPEWPDLETVRTSAAKSAEEMQGRKKKRAHPSKNNGYDKFDDDMGLKNGRPKRTKSVLG